MHGAAKTQRSFFLHQDAQGGWELQTEKNASPANPQPDRKAHDGSGGGQRSEIRSAMESTSVVKDSPSVENSAIAASSPAAVSLQGAQHSETHAPTASGPQSAMPGPYLQTEKNASAQQDRKAEASAVENSAIRTPHSEIATNSALYTLNSKLKSHAIRRWRAHIPRAPGTPEPDGSWRDACPCGDPAPCSEHPELKGRVRYYKPQHPDYQAGLKEFTCAIINRPPKKSAAPRRLSTGPATCSPTTQG